MSNNPQYYLDLYGDSTIAWVPPVSNYLFIENISKRGINDRDFRWEEVTVDLTGVQSGAVIDFVMPDYYLLQITPDIGWDDTLAMFGESVDSTIHNPHLQNLGPYSISAGTLTNNADNSVMVTLTTGEIERAVIDGFPKYLWRAVPWADGNPGYGGLPASFEWVSSADQLKFTVDTIKKETQKSSQSISGTKGPRVSITIESDNNPTVFVEQTSTTWKVVFSIDRPQIKFTIVATDEGGSAISKYFVNLSFDISKQIKTHIWNAFDSFALLASLIRLPGESNLLLQKRTQDAFKNKGGSHYVGLISGINRELGLKRKDNAISIVRNRNDNGSYFDGSIIIEVAYNRLSIASSSFVIYDEIHSIDIYDNSITLEKRIDTIISIKTESNQDVPVELWHLFDGINSVANNKVVIDPLYKGLIKVSYAYKEDISFADYDTVIEVVNALNNAVNPDGYNILTATIDGSMTGSEKSLYLYRSYKTIINDSPITIGWSPIGLFSISDEEFKWSFADDSNMFFNDEFYRYVIELKSSTNTEWGHVISDEAYWDIFDSKWYGRDSLPLAFDIHVSKYNLTVSNNYHAKIFDPYEALRMNYYYDGNLLSNSGFPQHVFKSGVGYKKDCAVSFSVKAINSNSTKINMTPLIVSAQDVLTIDDSIDDIIVTI